MVLLFYNVMEYKHNYTNFIAIDGHFCIQLLHYPKPPKNGKKKGLYIIMLYSKPVKTHMFLRDHNIIHIYISE